MPQGIAVQPGQEDWEISPYGGITLEDVWLESIHRIDDGKWVVRLRLRRGIVR